MLVTSVVLRPERGTITAAMAEAAEAFDNPSINAVFAILADDNASASERLDGFVGQILVEAATAADTVSAGSIRYAAIVEETNAAATFIAVVPGPVYAAIVETATASSAQNWVAAAVASAVLEGVFVDPRTPSTLLGTDVLDSGPVTVFEP